MPVLHGCVRDLKMKNQKIFFKTFSFRFTFRYDSFALLKRWRSYSRFRNLIMTVTFQKAKSIVNICGNFLKCRSYKCNYFLEHTLIVAAGRYWLIIFNSWDRWNSSVGDIILSRYEVVWNSRFYHQDHLDFVKHLINVLMICLKKFILIVNGWL